ncbi:hypothetical protein FHS16_005582 [Paenibacillus endophyticus]|uniref:Secreted protein n=1 Tax=Paenibacillus endophyticus TaxID=1294268 RepID=A0A7W5CDZ7_9BACL|nr:hypothetical protein [Paenibacillus endophyticus]
MYRATRFLGFIVPLMMTIMDVVFAAQPKSSAFSTPESLVRRARGVGGAWRSSPNMSGTCEASSRRPAKENVRQLLSTKEPLNKPI